MSWRDRLRPASFRGVEFSVVTVESEFGRRQVTHQAALVDVPTSEDLGRAADSFQVEGFLVGEDYDQARDELIKAIRDTPGPGRLVHPYQGEKSVIASGFRIREESEAQRMCRFTVVFGEAGELSQPTEMIDGPNVLNGRAEQVKDVAEENFIDKFTTDGFPQFVRDSATSTISGLSTYLATPTAFLQGNYNAAVGIFNSVNGVVGGALSFVSDQVSDFQSLVSDFAGDVSSLVDAPGDLASRITNLISGVRTTFGASAGSILSGLLAYFSRPDNVDEPVIPTPSRSQVIANNSAVTSLIRETVAAELAVVAVTTEYETIDSAVEVRDTVAAVIDGEAEVTTSDDVYTQLTQARAELIQSLPAPDQSPARIVEYVPAATLPALVIAQTLYDDATQEATIVTRNRPRHPGFVTGGQPLQVLTDV